MRAPRKKHLAIAGGTIAAIAAAATLIAGVTFGLFSSQVNAGSQTFTAGTVTLTSTQVVTCTLAPGDVKPGDSGTCDFNYTYSGNPAWLAVDIAGTSTASSTPPPAPYGGGPAPTAAGLLDGSNPLSLSIGSGSALTLTSHAVADVLLSAPTTPTTPGAGTVTLHGSLPLAAGNEYQGGSATVTLTIHAVQSKNNPTAGSLTPCTQYAVCTAATPTGQPFGWS
jgi:predicted ribosomally synthesized peptide with SipW-like signal peptide